MVKALLAKLWQRSVKRKLPYIIYSWRFLLPANGYLALHRKALGCACRQLRFGPVLISLQLCCWLVFHFWVGLWRQFRRHRQSTRQVGVSYTTQLLQLIRAGIGRGIPAHDYYRYQLYRYSAVEWWQFIYDQQATAMHRAINGTAVSATSTLLLNDKVAFAQKLSAENLTTATTLAILEQRQAPDWQKVFIKQSVFFKPVAASRSQGCFALHYHAATESYSLVDETNTLTDNSQIQQYIKQQTLQHRYMLQSLLQNHPALAALQSCERTITLRVVSGMTQQGVVLVAGNLELNSSDFKRFKLYALNCETGGVVLDDDTIPADFSLPYWAELQKLIYAAHILFPDVKTIGWDLVITPQQVLILEGNISWAAAPLQIALGQPLLPIFNTLALLPGAKRLNS